MLPAKKQKIDLYDDTINQIDIACENLLKKYFKNECLKKTINKMREEMITKVKETENEQKYVYFVQKSNKDDNDEDDDEDDDDDNVEDDDEDDENEDNDEDEDDDDDYDYSFDEKQKKNENLLGNLVILNQDLSHIFNNLRHEEYLEFEELDTFQEMVQSHILRCLMESKMCDNVIIDLSDPLQNILESAYIQTETIENYDCVSGLINVDKVTEFKAKYKQSCMLTSEFFRIFKNLKKLELHNVIQLKNCSLFNNLEHLKIEKCGLRYDKTRKVWNEIVQKDQFLGLKNLKTLILYNNRIRNINPSMFFGLENLVTLDLRDCSLRSLKMNIFKHLENLENLKLADQQLLVLENGCFNCLKNLKSLIIKFISEKNEIIIQNNVFDDCPRLECLRLSSNKIDNLDKLEFKHAQSLKVLCLDVPNIKNVINFINQFKNLECLNIRVDEAGQSLNNICLDNVKTMVINCYEFPKLEKNFHNLRALNIMIQNNKILDLNFFDECVNLDYMSLYFCKFESIRSLSEKHFDKLRNLKYLKIQLYKCRVTNLNELHDVFDTIKDFCKQLSNGQSYDYKLFIGSNKDNQVLNSYCEFKMCESSEIYYKKCLNISPQNIEFLLNEFKIINKLWFLN
ncbi:unnamed protein product [Brachionus calyciflorus]|uniref:Uncharacterized protein n=1 Tax=Brachionus calyciflorus TaxID=104777 RepID=A0A814KRA9_9BILA|nr:unnamed protein product [Brachionus calyciflorus]